MRWRMDFTESANLARVLRTTHSREKAQSRIMYFIVRAFPCPYYVTCADAGVNVHVLI